METQTTKIGNRLDLYTIDTSMDSLVDKRKLRWLIRLSDVVASVRGEPTIRQHRPIVVPQFSIDR